MKCIGTYSYGRTCVAVLVREHRWYEYMDIREMEHQGQVFVDHYGLEMAYYNPAADRALMIPKRWAKLVHRLLVWRDIAFRSWAEHWRNVTGDREYWRRPPWPRFLMQGWL